MKKALLIFVKLPVAGKVKTRLGKDVGDAQAALFYTAFVEDLFARVDKSKIETLIFFDPEEPVSEYFKWLGDRNFLPQRGKDLGERMLNAFKDAFGLNYNSCVLTGSDLPDLSLLTIEHGLNSLDKYPACIGPAKDGGYYLIGFRADKLTEIPFIDMHWSTPLVFQQTMQKFKTANLGAFVLQEHSDIDTLQDLKSLLQNNELEKNCPKTFKTYQDYLRNN